MTSIGHFDFVDLGAYSAEFRKRCLVCAFEDRVAVGLLRAFDRRFLEFDCVEQNCLLALCHGLCSLRRDCRVFRYGGSYAERQA